MGTQQSRSGHGRQGSHQQGQQSDRRPQQDRDLQRNKQSDRSQQQQHQQGDRNPQQQGGGSSSDQSANASGGRQQGQQAERQQSQLGGNRDFTHKMENEGREQNREQQNMRRQQSQQNAYGEGNYAASRQYNEATKDYTQSGQVESAARAAAPKSDAEARQMDAAEAEGKRHAKGEDPALTRGSSMQSPESGKTPRPGQEEE